MTSRREFVERSALSAIGLAVPPTTVARATASDELPARAFVDIIRPPDYVVVETAGGREPLTSGGGERWNGTDGVEIRAAVHAGALAVTLTSPSVAVRRVHLRWQGRVGVAPQLLGDAWERGYGDLEWRGWVPDRVMPWYFATHEDGVTHCYGVRTNCAAFCYWQVDPHGISLFADVRSGTAGVLLGERALSVCDVVSRGGRRPESSFAALHAFCRTMCPAPRLPSQPVYGSNDWYWAYGDNSADSVRTDARHIVELSPAGGVRPFVVIDDGWQPERGKEKRGGGSWDRGNEKFPDMPELVADIRRIGARGGIWIRPLQASADAPASWRLSRDRNTLDPSVPEVLHKVAADVTRLREWGFDLIKHDYTTYDIFGRWGSTMGSTLTRDGWTFAAGPGKTTAEVISAMYRTIRVAAADSLVIGCNTVSHLSPGYFEMSRVGDDTSGTEWARTRRMGVNSLAFRGAQHGAFYVADADCVGVTTAVPWALTRQWLELLARSGTMLFTSLATDALGIDQRHDLKAAFALAAVPQPLAEPLDWQRAVYPERWTLMHREQTFDWTGTGAPRGE